MSSTRLKHAMCWGSSDTIQFCVGVSIETLLIICLPHGMRYKIRVCIFGLRWVSSRPHIIVTASVFFLFFARPWRAWLVHFALVSTVTRATCASTLSARCGDVELSKPLEQGPSFVLASERRSSRLQFWFAKKEGQWNPTFLLSGTGTVDSPWQ